MKEFEILGNKDTRSGFGDGLLELAKTNENVVALCADLTGSLKMIKHHPVVQMLQHGQHMLLVHK